MDWYRDARTLPNKKKARRQVSAGRRLESLITLLLALRRNRATSKVSWVVIDVVAKRTQNGAAREAYAGNVVDYGRVSDAIRRAGRQRNAGRAVRNRRVNDRRPASSGNLDSGSAAARQRERDHAVAYRSKACSFHNDTITRGTR